MLLKLFSVVVVPGSNVNVKNVVTALYLIKGTAVLSFGLSTLVGNQLLDLARPEDEIAFEALGQVLVLTGSEGVSDGLLGDRKVVATLGLLALLSDGGLKLIKVGLEFLVHIIKLIVFTEKLRHVQGSKSLVSFVKTILKQN